MAGTSKFDDVEAENKAIGDRLRELRGMIGVQQAEMAQMLDVSPQAMGHYEDGRRSFPMQLVRRIHSRWPWLDLYWLLVLDDKRGETDD